MHKSMNRRVCSFVQPFRSTAWIFRIEPLARCIVVRQSTVEEHVLGVRKWRGSPSERSAEKKLTARLFFEEINHWNVLLVGVHVLRVVNDC